MVPITKVKDNVNVNVRENDRKPDKDKGNYKDRRIDKFKDNV